MLLLLPLLLVLLLFLLSLLLLQVTAVLSVPLLDVSLLCSLLPPVRRRSLAADLVFLESYKPVSVDRQGKCVCGRGGCQVVVGFRVLGLLCVVLWL